MTLFRMPDALGDGELRGILSRCLARED